MEFIPQFLLPLPDALQVEVEEDRQQGEEEGEEGGESKSETHCESQSTLHCTLCTVTELTQLLSLLSHHHQGRQNTKYNLRKLPFVLTSSSEFSVPADHPCADELVTVETPGKKHAREMQELSSDVTTKCNNDIPKGWRNEENMKCSVFIFIHSLYLSVKSD